MLPYPLLQGVPIEIMKIGLRTLILNHFRLGQSGFNIKRRIGHDLLTAHSMESLLFVCT